MTATVTPIRGAWKSRLVKRQTRRGDEETVNCSANAVTILRNDPKWVGVLAWNELAQAIACRKPAPWHPDDMPANPDPMRPWSDTDGMRVQNYLQREWGLTVSEQVAYRAALVVAEAHPFDPLREAVLALKWDGLPRVHRWLPAYFGVEDTEYARLVGRIFIVGAIARALRPGCKMDTMLILEGPQGLFKSQGVERLFGERWFRETPIDLRSNDRFLSVRDCWCREWPELDGHGKTDAARVKSFLSAKNDDFRAPYARAMASAPRRCVFVATVNPPELGYLVDESGNRRMLPVECGKTGPIDLDAISTDREQIFAEALVMYQAGAKWWPANLDEQRLCNQEQDARMVAEVWSGKIGQWLEEPLRLKPDTRITVRQVLGECLNVPAERWDKSNSTRVGHCLARAGWVIGGQQGKDRERFYIRRPTPVSAPTPDDDERAALAAQ